SDLVEKILLLHFREHLIDHVYGRHRNIGRKVKIRDGFSFIEKQDLRPPGITLSPQPIDALDGELIVLVVSLNHHFVDEDAVIRKDEHAALAKLTAGCKGRGAPRRMSRLKGNPCSSHFAIAIVMKYRNRLQLRRLIYEINRSVGCDF